jgi:hypothetical protein
MQTFKLSIPLHMNMDYVRLIMSNWQQTEYVEYDIQTSILNVSIIDGQLCEELDELWCSKSPDGSVGFADFIQTFGV